MKIISVTKLYQFNGHQNCIYSLNFSTQPESFYSGGAEGYLVDWNYGHPGDGKLTASVGKAVYSICVLPQSQSLLAGTASGSLHVIDLETNKEVRQIKAHEAGIFGLQVFEGHLYSCGGDGMIHRWNTNDLSLTGSVRVSDKSTRIMAYAAHRHELLAGSSDFKIRVLDIHSLEIKQTIDAHAQSVFALAFSADGRKLFSGGRDAALHVWDVENNYTPIMQIPAHLLHINQIKFNPSGTLFATCSMDKTIKIWDAATIQLLKVIDSVKYDGHRSSVNCLLWTDDEHLLSGSDDRSIMYWELGS